MGKERLQSAPSSPTGRRCFTCFARAAGVGSLGAAALHGRGAASGGRGLRRPHRGAPRWRRRESPRRPTPRHATSPSATRSPSWVPFSTPFLVGRVQTTERPVGAVFPSSLQEDLAKARDFPHLRLRPLQKAPEIREKKSEALVLKPEGQQEFVCQFFFLPCLACMFLSYPVFVCSIACLSCLFVYYLVFLLGTCSWWDMDVPRLFRVCP